MAKSKVKRSTLQKSSQKMSGLLFVLIIAVIGVIALGISAAAPRNRYTLSIPDGVYGGLTTATLTANTLPSDPWVIATCYQSGSPVIFNRLGLDSNGQATLSLGPTDGWKVGLGGADCTADIKNWNLKRQRWENLTSTTFHVSD
jgi:hypothetical protein